MGDLLSRLASFLNVQKAVAVSVPGIVLALAIAVIPYSWHPASRSPETSISDPDLPESCAFLSARTMQARGGSGRMGAADWQRLDLRRQQIEKCTWDVRRRIVDEQRTVAGLGSRIDADQRLADAFAKEYQDYEKRGAEGLASRNSRLSEQALTRVNTARVTSKAAELKAAMYTDLVGRLQQEQKDIVQRLKAGEQEGAFATILTRLVDNAMSIVLLGIVLGMILDPLTRQMQKFLYTDGRIRRYNEAFGAPYVASSAARKALGGAAPDPADTSLVDTNYAIGYKLISEADVDALENRYGLSSQFGLGLILPLAVLLVALGMLIQNRAAGS